MSTSVDRPEPYRTVAYVHSDFPNALYNTAVLE
jgi:hypothetical protein